MQQIENCIDRALRGEKPLAHKYKAIVDELGLLHLYHYHHLLLIYNTLLNEVIYTWHETPTDKRGLDNALAYLKNNLGAVWFIASQIGGKVTTEKKFIGEANDLARVVGKGFEIKVGDNRIGVSLNEDKKIIALQRIAVEKKGTGLGKKFIQELKNYADRTGKTIAAKQVSNTKFFKLNGFEKEGQDWYYTPKPTIIRLFRGEKPGSKGNWWTGSKKQAEVFANTNGPGTVREQTVDITHAKDTGLRNTNTYPLKTYADALGISESDILEGFPEYDQKLIKHGVEKAYTIFEAAHVQKKLQEQGYSMIAAVEPHGVKTTSKSYLIFEPGIFEQGGLLAPNGKPSNLTLAQYALVRTPAFKAWFGDWENDPANASKVVDENGEPLVVYHGTNQEFDKFEPVKTNFYAETIGWYFFTDNKKAALNFGSITKEYFLNITNPTYEKSGFFRSWNLYDDEGAYGFIAPNTDSGGGIVNQYAVENSNQIKLADGTNTTFDADSPDIRFAKGGHLTPYPENKLMTIVQDSQLTLDHMGENSPHRIKKKLPSEKIKQYVREIDITLRNLEDIQNEQLTNSQQVAKLARKLWETDLLSVQEQFYVLFLDRMNKVIGYDDISKGSITGTVVDLGLIVGIAAKARASNVVILHNHPSGQMRPSDADTKITKKLKDALALIDVQLIDHIILSGTDEQYYSFADEGIFAQGGHVDHPVVGYAAKGGQLSVDEEIKRVTMAPSVKFWFTPEFATETSKYPQIGPANSFVQHKNRGTVSGGKKWESDDIVAYDRHGKIVGSISVDKLLTPGAFKIVVREDAQRKGLAKKLLAEAERAGIAINWGANSYTDSGRRLAISWLKSKKSISDGEKLAKGGPTQKQVVLDLFEQATIEQGWVLDPFAGSGVVGEQAVYAKRNVHLVEKLENVVNDLILPRVNKTISAYDNLAKGGNVAPRNIWIRFNLSLGENFGKWKVENKATGKVVYLDPDKVQIVMHNCILSNQPATAQKIFDGLQSKSPIAYVKCEKADILYDVAYKPPVAKWLHYNPHLAPNWYNLAEQNIDNTVYPILITHKRRVYIFNADKVLDNLEQFQSGGQPKSEIFTELDLLNVGAQLELELFDDKDVTVKEIKSVAQVCREERESAPDPQLTLLSFGGGQDSFAILYSLIHDKEFRQRYAPKDLVVAMSDTGNEFPYTYEAIKDAEALCKKHNIPFFFLKPEMGFHTPGWQNLKANLRRNKVILGAAMKSKACTISLKINVIDKFFHHYMCELYGFAEKQNKQSWAFYQQKFQTPARVLIGFAKDEEGRVVRSQKMHQFLPKWKKANMQYVYPLIEEGWNRAKAQEVIGKYTTKIPAPSNCMLCFYQSDQEILWLYRNYPNEFNEWVELEKAKLDRFAGTVEKNYGVYGKLTLMQKLEKAQKLYGHMTNDELWEYKMSHGHCIKSTY